MTEDREAGRGKREADKQEPQTKSTQPGGSQAGQEARRGVPPGEHDTEHQSNYGGGGENGGAGKQ